MKVIMNGSTDINKNNYLYPMIQSLNTKKTITYSDGNPDLDLGTATKSVSLKITNMYTPLSLYRS